MALAARVMDRDLERVLNSGWSSPDAEVASAEGISAADSHKGEDGSGAGEVPYGIEVVLEVEKRLLGLGTPTGLKSLLVSTAGLPVRGLDSL